MDNDKFQRLVLEALSMELSFFNRDDAKFSDFTSNEIKKGKRIFKEIIEELNNG